MSQLFTSGGQSIGVSASASVLSMNTQDWSPLGWTVWISLESKGLHSSKASVLQHSAFFTVQLSHPYMSTGKTIALTRWTFVDKVMSLGIYLEGELIEYVAVLCFTSSGTVNLFHGGCWSPVYTFYFFIDILIQFMHCFPDFLQSLSRFSFGFLSIFSIIVL